MNTNLLKIFAGDVIVQTEMDKAAKRQLLNFVEGATEHQVKVLMMDGEIIPDPVDLVTYEIIDQRFNVSGVPTLVEAFKKDLESYA